MIIKICGGLIFIGCIVILAYLGCLIFDEIAKRWVKK